MKTIWKYTIASSGKTKLFMPLDHKILCAREQGDALCVWAEVDPSTRHQSVATFAAIMTGQDVPEFATYIGTAHFCEGRYVVHAYSL